MYQHVIHYLLAKALKEGYRGTAAREYDLIHIGKYFWYDGYEGFNTDH